MKPVLRQQDWASQKLADLFDDQGKVVKTGFVCDQCNDFIFDQEGRWSSTEAFCNDCAMNLDRRRIYKLEVPTLYWHATIDDLPTKIKPKAKKWPSPIKNLMILGICGSGKTFSCWAIAKHVTRVRKVPVIYTYGSKARQEWIKAIDDRKDRQLLKRWVEAPFLIFDDFTSANSTDGWKEAFFTIINERGMNERPTLVTCSDTGETVEAKYGLAVYSRLRAYEIANMPAKDLRKGKE